MSNMNNKVKKVLKLACLEAGKIILKNYGKKKNVKSKGNNDWVTNQDILIEKKNIKGTELSKKTLGIIGFGNVGVRLSKLVKGFDMKILVNSKSLESRKKDYPHVENASFEDLISKSDIISFHCKAPKDGKPMISKEHYKKMKPTAYIINAARGNIVDEKDLHEALNENLIAGAAVDVFSKEPAKENILFNNPKVVLTPHIAASTTEASIVVAEMVANQLSDFLLKGVKINTV